MTKPAAMIAVAAVNWASVLMFPRLKKAESEAWK
jgi:hypothetical protein